MESPATSSPPRHHLFKPSQQFTERILRALRHRLLLLHRSESEFIILGATCNVYTVTLKATPSCTCPDRATPCKHIFFVFIRVLGLSPDDFCLRRRSLRPCQLNRLLGTPTAPDSWAGLNLREKFYQLIDRAKWVESEPTFKVGEGTACPICLEEMGEGENVVSCGTCKNPIHEECLLMWKKSKGKRSASCVICRARWKDRTGRDRYLNLAAYVSEEPNSVEDVGVLCGD